MKMIPHKGMHNLYDHSLESSVSSDKSVDKKSPVVIADGKGRVSGVPPEAKSRNSTVNDSYAVGEGHRTHEILNLKAKAKFPQEGKESPEGGNSFMRAFRTDFCIKSV